MRKMKKISAVILTVVMTVNLLALCAVNAFAVESISTEEMTQYTGGTVSAMQYDFKASPYEEGTIKDKLFKSIYALEPKVNVIDFGLSLNEVMSAYWEVIVENPRMFCIKVKNNTLTCSYKASAPDKARYLYVEYEVTAEEIAPLLNNFDTAVSKALAGIDSSMSDVEKAIKLHDYILLNCQYNPQLQSTGIYGMFVNKTGICTDYAAAYQYLMQLVGIPSIIVSSTEMNHAWNMIQIDGEWYHADLTWDDPTPDLLGAANHGNFLLSDAGIRAAGHYNWTAANLPTASSTKYDDYFWKNITSEIFMEDGLWRYMSSEGKIATVNPETGTEASAIEIEQDRWWYWGSTTAYWVGNFTSVLMYNSKIYYNTSINIYRMNTDGSWKESIYSIDAYSVGGYIYGIGIKDGKLVCSIKKEYSDPDRFIEVMTLEEPKTVVPFENGTITDESHWENVEEEINSGGSGEELNLSFQGDNVEKVIPKSVLNAAKENDVDITIDMGTYKWVIDSSEISDEATDVNLDVNINLGEVPDTLVKNISEENEAVELNLTHDGKFGFNAEIVYQLGEEYAGKLANIYYFNEALNKMEKLYSIPVRADGTIQLKLNHASSYVSVIADKALGLKGDFNCDGMVTGNDLIKYSKYFLQDKNVTPSAFFNADIDDDGVITLEDFASAKKCLIGEKTVVNNVVYE